MSRKRQNQVVTAPPQRATGEPVGTIAAYNMVSRFVVATGVDLE
jgi:hypothetical protein